MLLKIIIINWFEYVTHKISYVLKRILYKNSVAFIPSAGVESGTNASS
jgi:hypothetical protein